MAFRSVPRPSSPPGAKASTECPSYARSQDQETTSSPPSPHHAQEQAPEPGRHKRPPTGQNQSRASRTQHTHIIHCDPSGHHTRRATAPLNVTIPTRCRRNSPPSREAMPYETSIRQKPPIAPGKVTPSVGQNAITKTPTTHVATGRQHSRPGRSGKTHPKWHAQGRTRT